MFFNKKILTILLVSSFLFVGNNVFASFSDGFDTYIDGSLDGQGGWVGHQDFQVQATTTQAGLKAIFSPQTTYQEIAKSIYSLNGKIIGWLQDATSSTTESIGIDIDADIVGVVGELWFNDTGGIEFWGNTGEVILTDYSPDTWYKVEIEWRNSDGYLRARANSGDWSSWLEPQASWSTMRQIVLTGLGEGYFDSLSQSEKYITISSEWATSTLAYAGQLFTDLSVPIILTIGLPLGFWVIKKIISLVRVR